MAKYSRALVMIGVFVQSLADKRMPPLRNQNKLCHIHCLSCKTQQWWQWQHKSSRCFVRARDMILGQVRGRDRLAVKQASIILKARGNLGVSKVSQIFTQHPSAVIFFLRHASISVARKNMGRGLKFFSPSASLHSSVLPPAATAQGLPNHFPG